MTDLVETYERYLRACNARDWELLAASLADPVTVNGVERSPADYVRDLERLLTSFPDYAWELRQTVAEPPWLAVRLADRGTRAGPFLGAPGDGTVVSTVEHATYRFDSDGRIAEVWVVADNQRLARVDAGG